MDKLIEKILGDRREWGCICDEYPEYKGPCGKCELFNRTEERLRELLSGDGDELEPLRELIPEVPEGGYGYSIQKIKREREELTKIYDECQARVNARRAEELVELEAFAHKHLAGKAMDELQAIIDKRKGGGDGD